MRKMGLMVLVAAAAAGLGGCARPDARDAGKPRVVATTSMIADLANVLAGERVEVTGLMGPGIDPHLYKASAGDVAAMTEAGLILYNGLHLEGKMGEVFEKVEQLGIPAVALAAALPKDQLLTPPEFAGNHDPHVWFDVTMWREMVQPAADALVALDPEGADVIRANADAYRRELDTLDAEVAAAIGTIPESQRILITAHDAFNYFGRRYGLEVRGLQGISTATEAGTADVRDLAIFITDRRIPAIFVESSVSPKTIEAVQAAVRARGFDVAIGGQLYSDALGDPGTEAGTYLGMVRANVRTIVDALTGTAGEA